MTAIYVTVSATRGSVPREVGAWMCVTRSGQSGTIGGGALEWDATRIAREMLAEGQTKGERVFPLGPALGQCCGGAVTVTFSDAKPQEMRGKPLWIWGAGHVGRAVVSVFADLPDVAVTWLDDAPERFPEDVPASVRVFPAPQLTDAMAFAPHDSDHLIFTYSHELDLALCHAALMHRFGSCGLIGAATKWARFSKRLSALGHGPAQIARITCPIGEPVLGKHPKAIAVGVVSRYLSEARQQTTKTGGCNDQRASDS